MRSDWWRGADAEEPGESRRLGDMVVAMVEVEGGAPVAILPTRRERKDSGEEGDAQKLAPCHKIMMKTFTMFLCLLDTKSHKVECSSQF